MGYTDWSCPIPNKYSKVGIVRLKQLVNSELVHVSQHVAYALGSCNVLWQRRFPHGCDPLMAEAPFLLAWGGLSKGQRFVFSGRVSWQTLLQPYLNNWLKPPTPISVKNERYGACRAFSMLPLGGFCRGMGSAWLVALHKTLNTSTVVSYNFKYYYQIVSRAPSKL